MEPHFNTAAVAAAAEMARAGMLNGNMQTDLAGLIKLENEARRTLRGLGLKVEKPAGPSVCKDAPWA